MNLRLKGLLLVLVAAALVAGCYQTGPDGTVTGRSSRYAKGAGTRFWLTVTTPTGQTTKFRVPANDYRHCFHQSHYPACTHR